jgi:hypothetical protein
MISHYLTQFESLDPALNDAFKAYLRKHSIDSALAWFVLRYARWKEQRVCAFFPHLSSVLVTTTLLCERQSTFRHCRFVLRFEKKGLLIQH